MNIAQNLTLHQVADEISKTPGKALRHERAARILRVIAAAYSAEGLHSPEEYKLLEEIGLNPDVVLAGESKSSPALGSSLRTV